MGPGVRVRALAAHRQSPAMPKPAIAADVHEPLDVHGDLGAERSFDLELSLDLAPKAVHLLVPEILSAQIGRDPRVLEDLLRSGAPDPA